MYQFDMPTLMIRDPELIKLITLKDFEKFSNHRTLIGAQTDPHFDNCLFGTKGYYYSLP